MMTFTSLFPVYEQLRQYNATKFSHDVVAALIVTIMLIPQSLAYAMLAGVPPEYGLYASIIPLVVYAALGSSTALAVGPVAIASIMTASALHAAVAKGVVGYVDGATTLALLSGLFLFVMGILRLGFLANFLSHSVVSGFITASGVLIALSQLKHILGISSMSGNHFVSMVQSLIHGLVAVNFITLGLGIAAIFFLVWARSRSAILMMSLGLSKELSSTLARIAPVVGVIVTTLAVFIFDWHQKGVAIVGNIPLGIGQFGIPAISLAGAKELFMPAILISIIGYVESISVGRTLGAKRRERITPNQELLALGGANVASAVSGAFPVTGGFSRSVVNYDAGAATQMAGFFTAMGIALACVFLTPFLYYLPIAMLAATIIVAVLSLVDFSVLRRAWDFSKRDFFAVLATIILTLAYGVEAGVAAGIIVSILLHLAHTAKPHIAELGLIAGSEHFRNVNNYVVETHPSITILRIDESLLFSNANYLEDQIDSLVNQRSQMKHLVIHFGAVNAVDFTALEMLENVNDKLSRAGISLHLAEVKVPVRQLLDRAGFTDKLYGKLYISPYQALTCLSDNGVTI